MLISMNGVYHRTVWFFFGCVTSQLFWKIYLSISRHSHKFTTSLRLLGSKSNPWTIRCLYHSQGSVNWKILIILSSGCSWFFLNRVKCSMYYTIFLTHLMNLHILYSWGSNKTQHKYLFWYCSAFGGNKCFARPCMTIF